jgi:hypothetical protein
MLVTDAAATALTETPRDIAHLIAPGAESGLEIANELSPAPASGSGRCGG